MIRNDQIIQVAAPLDKKLKIYIFTFYDLISYFSKNKFHFQIPIGRRFPTKPNFLLFKKIFKKLEWFEK